MIGSIRVGAIKFATFRPGPGRVGANGNGALRGWDAKNLAPQDSSRTYLVSPSGTRSYQAHAIGPTAEDV